MASNAVLIRIIRKEIIAPMIVLAAVMKSSAVRAINAGIMAFARLEFVLLAEKRISLAANRGRSVRGICFAAAAIALNAE
jgi:hypothetical protein